MTGQGAAEPSSGLASGAGTAPTDAPIDFRVISGNPTAAELAAVTAVLSATIENLEDLRRHAKDDHGQTAWQRSQRPIRTPLIPAAGSWRSFSG